MADDDGYDIGYSASGSGSGSGTHSRFSSAAGMGAGQDESEGWGSDSRGAGAGGGEDALAIALEKEKVIKDIMQTQEGLGALLGRVDEVTDDIKKLTEENAMLQVYLDNMTKNTAMFAGGKGDKR